MIWILIVIAFSLLIGLSLYTIRLLKQLKIQKELIAKAKNNRVIRLKESIDIIARAMQSGECNLSEGVIRLTMLLRPGLLVRIYHLILRWLIYMKWCVICLHMMIVNYLIKEKECVWI